MVMIAAGYDDCDDSNPDPMSGLKPRKMRATNGGRAGAAARAAHVAAERSSPSTRRVVALSEARVPDMELWRHGAEHDINREDAVGTSRRSSKSSSQRAGNNKLSGAGYRTCCRGGLSLRTADRARRQQIQSKRRAEIGDQESIVGMYSDASLLE
jgi:hypothetical protein